MKANKMDDSSLVSSNFRYISIYPTAEDINSSETGDHIISGIYSDGKYDTFDHYLEIQFRFLREHFVQPFIERITYYRNSFIKPTKDLFVYTNVRIRRSQLKDDLVFEASFDATPLQTAKMNTILRHGSLLCLSYDHFRTFCFASVMSTAIIDNLSKGVLSIKFETQSLNDAFAKINPLLSLTMIESSSFVDAYNILETLQSLNSKKFILQNYIINTANWIQNLPYLSPTTKYNLTDLAYPLIKVDSDGLNAYKIKRLFVTLKNNLLIDSNKLKLLEKVSVFDRNSWPEHEVLGFDESQFDAFKAALTKQMVIIDGKSATGKTYVGIRIVQTLLHNGEHMSDGRHQSNHGPILIVSYSNQVLDEFLEGLVPYCQNIVRIGLNSKSAIIESFTLLSLKRKLKQNRTLPINYSIIDSRGKLEKIQIKLSELQEKLLYFTKRLMCATELKSLATDHEWIKHSIDQLCSYSHDLDLALIYWLSELNDDNNRDHNQDLIQKDFNKSIRDEYEKDFGQSIDSEVLETIDETDTKLTKINKQKFMILDKELQSSDFMTKKQAKRVIWLTSLTHEDRWRLYRRWLKLYCEQSLKQMEKLHRDYRIEIRNYNRLKLEEDLSVIRGRDLIGMTVSGVTKYRSIIEQIGPKVVVMEEASKVLECNVITCLTENTNHLILIGDKQQIYQPFGLRKWAIKLRLNLSLFERMINNQMSYFQLKTQHNTSAVMSSSILPESEKYFNGQRPVNLLVYENIKDLFKNVYLVNHGDLDFLAFLVKNHNYEPSQITIIAIYSSQIAKLTNSVEMYEILNGVRVTSIDNYRGHESDIIILSFVRNSFERIRYFPLIMNRVKVALSRANVAFYCIESFDCLSDQSQLWTYIINVREDEKNILCESEGAHNILCGFRLICGHVCPTLCFNHSPANKTVKCGKSYEDCAHRCPAIPYFSQIFDDTGKAWQVNASKLSVCCHQTDVLCIDERLKVQCQQRCERYLDCGHKCVSVCGVDCDQLACDEIVESMSQCGHSVDISCSQRNNDNLLLDICDKKCGALLKCGHICGGSCGQCQQNRLHIKCRMRCERVLICGHMCNAMCGDNCGPCQQKCLNGCSHSSCKQKCGEPCEWKCVCNQILLNSSVQYDMRDTELIKIKLFGNSNENKEKRKILIESLKRFVRNNVLTLNSKNKTLIRNKLRNLIEITGSKFVLFDYELRMIETKFDLLKRLTNISEMLCECEYKREFNKHNVDINNMIDYTNIRIGTLINFVDTFANNDQQIHDLRKEMNFIRFSSKVVKELCDRDFDDGVNKSRLAEALKLLSCAQPLNNKKKNTNKLLVKKVIEIFQTIGLNLLPEKKKIIARIPRFTDGEWFVCENRHVFSKGKSCFCSEI